MQIQAWTQKREALPDARTHTNTDTDAGIDTDTDTDTHNMTLHYKP